MYTSLCLDVVGVFFPFLPTMALKQRELGRKNKRRSIPSNKIAGFIAKRLLGSGQATRWFPQSC